MNVRVEVCVAVDVAGMGVREGVSVSAIFVDVGVDVEGGRDDWQAVRTRMRMKSERLSNILS